MENEQLPFTGPLESEYRTKCQFPGCLGTGVEWRIVTEGWRPGLIIPMDQSNPKIGLCPICFRHQMMVMRVPDLPLVDSPKGFWRLPTK